MSATERVSGSSLDEITEAATGLLGRPTPRGGWLGYLSGLGLTALLALGVGWLWSEGLGISGLNDPVASAFTLANFVFWIGIACAGVLVSAALFLLGGSAPTALYRIVERMSLAALASGMLFLWVQLGRPWVVFWLAPLPNQMDVWPQYRSPLAWTFMAVAGFAAASTLLAYLGALPDLARLRDRAQGRRRRVLAALALGWRGSQGRDLGSTHRIVAVVAAVLALGLLAIVSRDLAGAQGPGWHAPIFAPIFVVAAILSGVAMVVTVAEVARRAGPGASIDARTLDVAAKVLATAALVVGVAHFVERLGGGAPVGARAWAFAATVVLAILGPQLLWLERVRASSSWLLALSILALVGTWCERFLLVTGSLQRALLPATWFVFRPTGWDFALLLGGVGLFVALLSLLARSLPHVAGAEATEEPVRVETTAS